MKRASYRDAIEFVARNDETAEMDIAVITDLVTVLLVASIFDVDHNKVAKDVLNYRTKHFD